MNFTGPGLLIESSPTWSVVVGLFILYMFLYTVYQILKQVFIVYAKVIIWAEPKANYVTNTDNWDDIKNYPRLIGYTAILIPLSIFTIIICVPLAALALYAGHTLLSTLVTYLASLNKSDAGPSEIDQLFKD